MQVTREALEVPQHLEARDPQPAIAYRAHGGLLAAGMADDVPGVQHDLREAGLPDAASLASSGPASVIVSMPKWSMFIVRLQRCRRSSLTTSSKVTLPRYCLGERALLAGLHRATIDKHDAAFAQRAHRGQHVARAEAHRSSRSSHST